MLSMEQSEQRVNNDDRRGKIRRKEDREKLKFYKNVINFIDDFVFILSDDLTIVDCNDYTIRLLGYSKEEILTMNIQDIVDFKGECSYPSYVKTRENNLLFVHICSNKLSFGQLNFNIIVAKNLNDVRIAEKKVEELLLQQSTLLNNLGIHIWYLKDPYTYGFVNRSFLEFFGLEENKVINHKVSEVFCETDFIQSIIQENEKVFKEGKAVIIERWLKSSSGDERLFRITKLPKSNGTNFVACWGIDITEEYLETKYKKEKQRELEEVFISYLNQKRTNTYQKINDKISTLDTVLEIGSNIQSISQIGGSK